MGMNFKILIKEFWITQKWFNDNLARVFKVNNFLVTNT